MQQKAWESTPIGKDDRDALNCTRKRIVRGRGLGRELSQATISQYLLQPTVVKGGLNTTTNFEEGDREWNKVNL
jgi:hypothetical protein